MGNVRESIKEMITEQNSVTLTRDQFMEFVDAAAEQGAKRAREDFMQPFVEKIEKTAKEQAEMLDKKGRETLEAVKEAGRELEETGNKTLSDIRDVSEAAGKTMDALDESSSSNSGIHVSI